MPGSISRGRPNHGNHPLDLVIAETGRLMQQQDRQGRPIRQWQVVVICPSRELNFGDLTPVREFVRERLVWIDLAPERLP